MNKVLLFLLIVSFYPPNATPCIALYGQCGGIGYTGLTQCCSPATCQYNNDYYSQCLTGVVSTTRPPSTSSPPSTGSSSTECNVLYSQCGGQNWPGSTCCVNSICTLINPYYSQCLSSLSSSTTQAPASTTRPTTSASTASSSTTQAPASTTRPTTSASTASSTTRPTTSASTASSSTTQAPASTTRPTTSASTASSTTRPTTSASTASSSTTQAPASTTRPTTSASTASSSTTQAPASTTRPTTSASTASSSTTQAPASTTRPTTSASTASSSTTQAPASTTRPTTSASTVSSTTRPTTSASIASSTTRPTTSVSTASSSTTITTSADQGCSNIYDQCGGRNWSGPTRCCSGSTCQYGNDYYSQCVPISGPSTSSSSTIRPSTSSIINDGRADGVTTRYWDCCKASCAWSGKASVSNPVKTCAKDGLAQVDVNTQSACTNGTAYMCNNQQPWNVSLQLSYGYAAAHITGQGESNWCCACYSLIFTTGSIAGKEMIVQVTNTGGDLGNNHFDLQMPGGGFGIFDACTNQFGSSYSWGQRYGGVSQRTDCNNLPPVLRSGCFWRFDWFENADNPQMRLKQVTCPTVLTANTNCIRQ